MKVCFFKCVDAFLYLPIYVAEHLGIYEQIDSSLNPDFSTPDPKGGDIAALEAMIENSNKGDVIPIAVCDPFAMFAGGFGLEPKQLRVLGAVITKVPFWAVDGPELHKGTEAELGNWFKKIYYYNDALLTGHFIGRRTRQLSGIPRFRSVEFGQEFEAILEKSDGPSIAITCDIISVILHKNDPTRRVSINHSYAKNDYYRNFITTALVTTENICNEYPAQLAKVLEGLQRSIAVLRSSKRAAVSVCTTLAPNPEFYHDHHKINGQAPQLTAKNIEDMIDLIYEDDFYPASLDISRAQWEATLECHAQEVAVTDVSRSMFAEAKRQYETIVTNKYLLEAQKKFIMNVGINIEKLIEEEAKPIVESAERALMQVEAKRMAEALREARIQATLGTISVFGATGVIGILLGGIPQSLLFNLVFVGAFFSYFIWKLTAWFESVFREKQYSPRLVLTIIGILTFMSAVAVGIFLWKARDKQGDSLSWYGIATSIAATVLFFFTGLFATFLSSFFSKKPTDGK